MFVLYYGVAFSGNYPIVSYSKYPIDNKIHILDTVLYHTIEFNINIINKNGNYAELKDATCILQTSYTGKTGILVYIFKGQSYYSKYGTGDAEFLLHNNEKYTYKITGATNQYFPYYPTTFKIMNNGCSSNADGDVCRNAKQNNIDVLSVVCSYDK